MTTLILKDDLKISKTEFLNIYELYEYIEDTYILPDFKFTPVDKLNSSEIFELENAKKDNSKLINI